MRWLDSITDSVDMNFNKLQEIVEVRGACFTIVHGVKKSQIQLRQLKNNGEGLLFSHNQGV